MDALIDHLSRCWLERKQRVSAVELPNVTRGEACVQGSLRAKHLEQSWSAAWQQDMRKRDFTVNALMYDPFNHLLFDYMGGLRDCQKQRLHTIREPLESFAEDPPRMLRAVRLSARTGEPEDC